MTLGPPSPASEDVGLAHAEAQLSSHLEAVRRAFGAEGFGVIDLPPLSAGRLIGPQIAVGAVLYWAWELEQAGLLPFTERFASRLATGHVADATSERGARQLLEFWRSRRYRFGAPERTALFTRVFGGAAAVESIEPFLPLFTSLLDALRNLGRAPADVGIGPDVARTRALAREVGAMLSDRCVGIAAFAARDIADQVRAAIRLLSMPDVARTLGASTTPPSPFALLARHGEMVLGRPVRPAAHLSRAIHGNRVLEWIAREAATLESGATPLDRSHPVLAAAEAWRASGSIP